MSIDRDRLPDRLDPAAARERLEERLDADAVHERIDEGVDLSAVRERVDDGVDPAAVRAGLDGFYARYFLPPSVTEEEIDEDAGSERADVEPFDFGAWLAEGRGAGPEKPPAEPRVVTDAASTTTGVDADYEAFDFAAWLADGEEFEPIEVPEPESGTAERPAEAALEPEPAEGSLLQRPTFGIHPAKAATYALFLAVVALVGLTAAGHLPALGPTGLAG